MPSIFRDTECLPHCTVSKSSQIPRPLYLCINGVDSALPTTLELVMAATVCATRAVVVAVVSLALMAHPSVVYPAFDRLRADV